MRSPLPPDAGPGRLGRWWLDRSVRAKGMTVVAVPLLALVAVTSASLVLQHSERQERAVALTASALNNSAQQVVADAANAETGVRGYAATRDPVFLQPYDLTLTRLAGDLAVLRAAAVAQGDSRAERTVAATTATEMADLARLRSAVGAGAPVTVLRPALVNGKKTMDALRSQVAGLVRGPAAINLARRAGITRLASVIDWVSIAGLVLGLLAGLIGAAFPAGSPGP
jgi:CHASE3 domain sensor protein